MLQAISQKQLFHYYEVYETILCDTCKSTVALEMIHYLWSVIFGVRYLLILQMTISLIVVIAQICKPKIMTQNFSVFGTLSQGLNSAPVVGLVSKHASGIDRFLFILRILWHKSMVCFLVFSRTVPCT